MPEYAFIHWSKIQLQKKMYKYWPSVSRYHKNQPSMENLFYVLDQFYIQISRTCHISGALSFGSVCTSWLILAAHMYRKKAVTQDIQPVWSIRAVDHLVQLLSDWLIFVIYCILTCPEELHWGRKRNSPKGRFKFSPTRRVGIKLHQFLNYTEKLDAYLVS